MGFAQNLKYLMDSFDLSNYRLAQEIECHQSNVAYWLNGERKPQNRVKQIIAERFNISVDELMGDDLPPIRKNGQKNTAPTNGDGWSAVQLAFIEKLKLMDDDMINALNAVADTILSQRAK